ncbi:hypothetical protein [Paraburkholderia aspalathi]|uniref:hypothetical protein n=1 Tax=Paraburkholderia aspalathi TaxID=1324617 RepID=UPI0038B99B78
MPYKSRLKTGEQRKRKKPGYRVTNARAYNQSLRKRGMISLYNLGGDLKAQFINAKIRTPGVSGRGPTYTTAYIDLIFTFYRVWLGDAADHRLYGELLGHARAGHPGAQRQSTGRTVRVIRGERYAAL